MQTRKNPTSPPTPYEIFHDLAPPGLQGLTRGDPLPGETLEEYGERDRGTAVKAMVLFPRGPKTWASYLAYLTGLLRYIQEVRVRLLLDINNRFPPPSVEHIVDERAGDEVVTYLADGGEIRSGWSDKDDPDKLLCGDYLKLLDHEGREIAFVEIADLLAEPRLARVRLRDFLIASAGVRPCPSVTPGTATAT